VRDASKEYFADQDVVGQWFAECAELGPYEFPAGLAYDSFKDFAERNCYFVIDNREFKNALEQRGFEHRKGMKGRSWKGFRVTRLSVKCDLEPDLPASTLD
jgi:phage/plasmid-associated DNA primase